MENNKAGVDYIYVGAWREAEGEFRKAAEAAPSNGLFQNNLGSALARQGRTDEAIVCYQKAVELDGRNTLYRMNLGDVYRREAKVDQSLEAYRIVLHETPGRAGIHDRYVNASYDKGVLDTAVAELEALVKKEQRPDGIDEITMVYGSAHALAHASILMGRCDEAEERASRGLESLLTVKTERGGYVIPIVTPFFFYMRRVPKTQINLNGVYASFYDLRGLAGVCKGDYDQAAADFKKSAEKLPGGFGSLHLGRLLVNQGNAPEALYHFRRFLETSPNSSTGRLWYAIALQLAGQRADAEREWDEMRRGTVDQINTELPSNYEFLEALALADEAWGRTDEAITLLIQVTKFNPHSGWAYKKLASLQYARGDRQAAEEAVAKALALLPGDEGVRKLAQEIAHR